MTVQAAMTFIDKIEADEEFAERLASHRDDPAEVLRIVREAGFDVTPDEVKTAFLARYGSELSLEQLEALAGGSEEFEIGMGVLGASVLFLVAVAASF
mgnify:CR=1 FL=1